jgi:microcystin-dependent protein
MSCSNCYNGCQEIQSDKCVRYTGVNSAPLGIENGDNVNSVLETLISRVVSYLNGTGIDISIDLDAYCELVTKYLPACKPTCEPPTLPELLEALVKAACDLQGQIDTTNTALDAVEAALTTLNANYTVDCLSGVTASSDTHDVVQAIITKLCALNLDVSTNYVKKSQLNDLIQDYLDDTEVTEKYYTKMVPFTVVEYYGPLSGYPSSSDGFTAGGAGFGYWEKIYLCNGNTVGSVVTPDKRGRSPIGAIIGVGGGPLDSQVNPATSPLNVNYAVGTKNGVNGVVLSESNLPAHTHSATVTDTHYHNLVGNDTLGGTCLPITPSDPIASDGSCGGSSSNYDLSKSAQSNASLGKSSGPIGSTSVTIGSTGGNTAHTNTHPVIACYYIMYIP